MRGVMLHRTSRAAAGASYLGTYLSQPARLVLRGIGTHRFAVRERAVGAARRRSATSTVTLNGLPELALIQQRLKLLDVLLHLDQL